jgi:hypothetical protein
LVITSWSPERLARKCASPAQDVGRASQKLVDKDLLATGQRALLGLRILSRVDTRPYPIRIIRERIANQRF